MMAERPKATEPDRYWLDHEVAIVASGLTAKAYAAEQGVSLHALYRSRKCLRSLGLMSPPEEALAGKPKSRKRKKTSFARVEVLQLEEPLGDIRLRLPVRRRSVGHARRGPLGFPSHEPIRGVANSQSRIRRSAAPASAGLS